MSEKIVTLFELLDLAIGSPHKGAVNFSALHTLLHAMLRQLDIREIKTPWTDTPRGYSHPDAVVGVTFPKQDHHTEEEEFGVQRDTSTAVQEQVKAGTELQEQVKAGTELQEQIAPSSYPTPPSRPTSDGQYKLRSRIESCEDGVSKAMKLIQELHNRKDNLEEEMKELRHQQKRSLRDEFQKYPEELSQCVTWDVMQSAPGTDRENLQKSLRDEFQKYPEELSQCVTWDVMQSAPGTDRENLQELVNSALVDPATVVKPTYTPFNSNITAVNTAPPHTSMPSSPRFVEDTSRPGAPGSLNISGQISTDTQVATEAPLVPSGPLQTGPSAAGTPLTQKASVSERRSDTAEALRNIGRLKERFSRLEARVAVLEEGKVDQSQLTHLKELIINKGSQDTSNNVMDQLNQQRALIGSLMPDREKPDSLEAVHLTSQGGQTTSEATLGSKESDDKASHELRQQMFCLRKSVQKLEENMKQLRAKQALSAERTTDRDLQDQNVELLNDMQEAILQLQANYEKLYECTKCMHDDNKQRQSHIEELYKTTEQLEQKKADKQMVESEMKADKSALEGKVSRLQFDSVTEELNGMFHELLNKVTGQEQDWHKVVDRLSTEMECKLNRIELESMKKQLEDRWKKIHKKLQAQGAPEQDDAAGIRRQLIDRFHCLSCDRPVVMHTPGQHLVKLPSTPGFPSHKSIRPFTVYALEQFRQHYKSERLSEMTDYSHLATLRSCGGSHTVTSSSHRRTGLQYVKHHTQTEVEDVIQSEVVDIVGLDGHIYKGRLNAPATRYTEMKLPTVPTKDGMCRTKDKAKRSLSHKPAASPEVEHPIHHPDSAKSAQCSRPASSTSGRDWPVSSLDCTSQSSITAAAAESDTQPPADKPLNL